MKLILSSILVFIILFVSFIIKDVAGNPGLRAYSDEPKIYYRLARSEEYGVFSDAGLLGFCGSRYGIAGGGKARKKYSISSYLSSHCPDYWPYESQSGFEGFIYSLIDKFYKNPLIFRIFCASFFSAVMTAWFVWLYGYFGFIPSFLMMLTIPFFNDLVYVADNIAQVLGATYLIMVAMFWAYEKKVKNVGVVAFGVILLKLLLNGPEYIFSALLLPFLPLVFYTVLNRMPIQKIWCNFYLIMRGIFLGCLSSLLILMAQVSAVSSPTDALNYFIRKIINRTSFPHLSLINGHQVVVGMTRLKLLEEYLFFSCVQIGVVYISYGMMIIFFGIISILAFYLYRCYRQRVLLAILMTTWVSILCPLSWILIAIGHSTNELHDRLIWNMPFTLLGMVLTVVTLETLVQNNKEFKVFYQKII